MVTVVEEVGCRRCFDSVALDQRSLRNPLQDLEQLLAGCGNYAMLLQAPRDRQLHRGLTLDDASERHILARVVKTVGIVSQVVDDVEHQCVVGLLTRVEGSELPFQKVEQSGEVDVVGMPRGDWLGHEGLPRRPYVSTRGERSFDPDQAAIGWRL
jgi:hypothetical protein